MGRTHTMVELDDELVARLDQEAVRRGVSRSMARLDAEEREGGFEPW